MQLMVKDVDSNAYAFSVLVWHERLVYGAGAKGLEAGAAAAQLDGGGSGGGAAPGVGSRLFAGVGRMLGGGK
jgi:spore coat protein CotH